MCKNKYFNLISAVWSLGRGGTEELLPETASPASLCALCSRVVPALVLSVAQKQECKLFSFARQWANVHWKTDRLEIWGIKMPFAIIASPRKFMSICESLFCRAEGKWKLCACRIFAGRNKKIRHKKSTNAKSDCFEDWRRDRMIECRLNSTTLCGKTTVRAFLFSARMDWRHKNDAREMYQSLTLINGLSGGTSVQKTMRMHNFETVSVVKWHLLPTVTLIFPLIAQ